MGTSSQLPTVEAALDISNPRPPEQLAPCIEIQLHALMGSLTFGPVPWALSRTWIHPLS